MDAVFQGLGLAAVGMAVVFLSMVLLISAVLATRLASRRQRAQMLPEQAPPPKQLADSDLPPEVVAAIALALSLDADARPPRRRDVERSWQDPWRRAGAVQTWTPTQGGAQ